jgi:hypothetical protein
MLYAVVVIPLAIRHKERLSPDAVCYIRRAMYLSRGDFYHSVSSYWSPLISWCIAPWIAAGFDGLYAARGVMCIWGGVFILAVHWFLKRITTLGGLWRLLALCVVGLAAAPIAVRQITPDLILATCLFGYFALVVHRGLFENRRMQLSAGAMAGICFVAKAYALPFLLLHLPMTMLLRRRAERPRGIWAAFGTTSLAFAVICSAWIGVLSWRYGKLTINSSGKYAHAIVGPAERQKLIPAYFGSVEDPYITRNEVIESIPYPAWAPFESWEYFKHQCSVAMKNAEAIYRTVGQFDQFRVTLVGIGVAVLILVGMRFFAAGVGSAQADKNVRPTAESVLWLIASIMIYCSGFLPVFFVARYIVPVVLPLCLVLCLKIAMEMNGPKIVRTILGIVVLISFAAAASEEIRTLVGGPRKARARQISADAEETPLYREVAQEMRGQGISGPIVSPQRVQGIYVAFHRGQKFIGFPPDEDATLAEQKIAQFGPGALLIFREIKGDKKTAAATKLASEMARRGMWKLAFIKSVAGEKAEVYVPARLKGEGPR